MSLLDLALRMGRRSTSTSSSLTGAAIEPHARRSAALPTAGTGEVPRDRETGSRDGVGGGGMEGKTGGGGGGDVNITENVHG